MEYRVFSGSPGVLVPARKSLLFLSTVRIMTQEDLCLPGDLPSRRFPSSPNGFSELGQFLKTLLFLGYWKATMGTYWIVFYKASLANGMVSACPLVQWILTLESSQLRDRPTFLCSIQLGKSCWFMVWYRITMVILGLIEPTGVKKKKRKGLSSLKLLFIFTSFSQTDPRKISVGNLGCQGF